MKEAQQNGFNAEVCLRAIGLLTGISEQPDVDICACEQGITRVILGDRLEETPAASNAVVLTLSEVCSPSTTPDENGGIAVADSHLLDDRTDVPVRISLSQGQEKVSPAEVLALRHAQQAVHEIAEYLRGERQQFSVSLAPAPTSPFTARVHEAIATIPYGHRVTYAELAEILGQAGATRAVGTACGKNPLPIIVPCHRVVRADGSLGHYTGGDAIKAGLLARESG